MNKTPTGLIDELVAFCKEALSGLETKENSEREMNAPRVFAHTMPVRGYKADFDPAGFPFVVVSFLNGRIEDDTKGSCSIGFRIGTYAAGIDGASDHERVGWRAAMDIAWRLVGALSRQPLIGSAFMLIKPIEWELPPDQEPPYWFATAVADYSIAVPQDLQIPPDPYMDWNCCGIGKTEIDLRL